MSEAIDLNIASHLTSGSQRARVLTEAWLGRNGYCLNCASNRLSPTKANREVCDFVCPDCMQTYELKSSLRAHGRRVVDGAHDAMMRRVQATDAPALMLLRYTPSLHVERLIAVHPIFVTPLVMEKRPPLALTARRAGWVGCNIRLDRIPEDGKILLISNGHAVSRKTARGKYLQSARLGELKPESRGWTALVLAAVRSIGKQQFDLAEITDYERRFSDAYPLNKNIVPKVRQQLQVLRDLGYLEFVGRGQYRLVK